MQGQEIQDKRLAAAGVKITVQKASPDGIMLALTGNVWLITAARITAPPPAHPDLHPYEQASGETTFLGLIGDLPPNATLQLDLATQTQTTTIPFDLQNIPLTLNK